MTAMESRKHQRPPATLGDVLYSDQSTTSPSEKDWVAFVQSVANGDQLALHGLYERTHRVVFELISSVTRNPETTEEATVDVFCDIWRLASQYDAADDTVLGWIMNNARARALKRTSFGRRSELAPFMGDLLPQRAASMQERLAYRIAEYVNGEPVLPAGPQWLEPEWADVAPGISVKLLATDTERHRVSMLVRLAPGGDYPPHTHTGVEELHLLQGELWIDERKLYPGDYNRAEPGTGDKRVWSETGCTCVLMTSTKDILRGRDDASTSEASGVVAATPEPEDTYRVTLVRAAELVGGAIPLARRLQVPIADLTRWLAGFERPSMGTFLKAVDLLIEERGKPRLLTEAVNKQEPKAGPEAPEKRKR
jgi:DNA-directed RNA polymerase specialized sigma24 family protein